MPEPLLVAFVPGVTPDRWERTWRERRLEGRLEFVPMAQRATLEALRDGTVHMAFARDIHADARWHAIPLYRERPVVVAAIGSLVASLDGVDLVDLEDERLIPVDLDEGTGAAAVDLVAANTGVSVMPHGVARMNSRRDVVARPVRDGPDTVVSLVWPVAGAHPSCEAFIAIVRGRTVNSSR